MLRSSLAHDVKAALSISLSQNPLHYTVTVIFVCTSTLPMLVCHSLQPACFNPICSTMQTLLCAVRSGFHKRVMSVMYTCILKLACWLHIADMRLHHQS